MSKNTHKGFLAEGVLDTVFKGIVGAFFGGKLIDDYTKKVAMRDPKIQKRLKDIKKGLDDIDARLATLKQTNKDA